MADDIGAELAALEEAAPLTPEEGEEGFDLGGEGGEPSPEADKAPSKTFLKPEEYEQRLDNTNKALREAREARRTIERQHQQALQEQARMEQAWAQLQQRMLQQQIMQAPDPLENPEAARAWQQQVQQMQLQQIQQQQQQQIQQRQAIAQQEHVRHVFGSVEEIEADFKTQHPDYDEATDYLLGVQEQTFVAMGYSPQQAQQIVADWSFNVAANAINAGKNPAQEAYAVAQKMGWRPKNASGLDATQAAAAKLAQIKAGQASAQTMAGGGSPGAGDMSLKRLASLEGAAFDSAMNKFLKGAR